MCTADRPPLRRQLQDLRALLWPSQCIGRLFTVICFLEAAAIVTFIIWAGLELYALQQPRL